MIQMSKASLIMISIVITSLMYFTLSVHQSPGRPIADPIHFDFSSECVDATSDDEHEEKFNKIQDVNMDEDTQKWLFDECEEKNISPYIVLALIEQESDFNPECIYSNDRELSVGYMQINLYAQEERIGDRNPYDKYTNIEIGIEILESLIKINPDPAWVLCAYNGGASYANRLTNLMQPYAKSILERAQELEVMHLDIPN